MALHIVFETHSVTGDDEAGRAIGWLPGELSAYGRECARQLGERRRDDGLAVIFCSDLARAVQTVEIAFRGRRLPIHRDSRLRDCDYGELNGMRVTDLAAIRRRHVDEPFPGGQSYRQVAEQTRSLLVNLVAAWDGHRVLLVAHPANRWALDHLLRGRPLEELVDEPFDWREGWDYAVPTGWAG